MFSIVAIARYRCRKRNGTSILGPFSYRSFISDSAIAAVLNHSDGSVTGIYNRSEQLEQKSKALQKWADKIDRITGSKDEPAKITKT